MEKFTKASADKYIKSPSDAQVAKLGHLNEIVENVIPYKTYVALITQSGTNPPVATVLENTLGEVTIQRIGQGNYQIYSSVTDFPFNKTVVIGAGYDLASTLIPLGTDLAITGYYQLYNQPTAGFIVLDVYDDLFASQDYRLLK